MEYYSESIYAAWLEQRKERLNGVFLVIKKRGEGFALCPL